MSRRGGWPGGSAAGAQHAQHGSGGGGGDGACQGDWGFAAHGKQAFKRFMQDGLSLLHRSSVQVAEVCCRAPWLGSLPEGAIPLAEMNAPSLMLRGATCWTANVHHIR